MPRGDRRQMAGAFSEWLRFSVSVCPRNIPPPRVPSFELV
jgi:hypothetical protein